MRGVNKAIIVGTLGADPDVKYTAGGIAVATLSIATNEEWTDKNTGEKQKRTDWHRVKFFGRLAEIAGEYLKKGRPVYIEGKNRSDKYKDNNTGEDRYAYYILGEELQMLPGGDGNGGQGGGQRGNAVRDRQTQLDQRGPQGGARGGYSERGSYGGGGEVFDDDPIPF